MNHSGEILIPPMYFSAGKFISGSAVVSTNKAHDNHYLINTNNIKIKNSDYPSIIPATESNKPPLYLIINKYNKKGVINAKGDIILRPIYSDSRLINEGAIIMKDSESWAMFDRKGFLQLRLNFTNCTAPSEGLIGVQTDGMWGFCTISGEIAINTSYTEIHYRGFINGMIPARSKNALMGIVTNTGKWKLQPKFAYITRGYGNSTNIFVCKDENLKTWIYNGTSNKLSEWPNQSIEVSNFYDGVALAEQHGRISCLISLEGILLRKIPENIQVLTNFDQTDFLAAVAFSNGDQGYMTLRGEYIRPIARKK